MIFATLLTHNDPTQLIVWCGIGLCVGLYLFFNGFRVLQRRRVILDTPVSKIRSASLGTVEVTGLAVGPYTMPAPITARDCYFYRATVWEWKRQGRSNQWVRVAGECAHLPFFVDDNTGKLLIDPRGAELDLHRDFQQEYCDSFFTMNEKAPPRVHALLQRHGISTTNKIKVEEFCIKPKNALFLMGTLAENPGIKLSSQPSFDDEHSTRVSVDEIWSSPVHLNFGRSLVLAEGIDNSSTLQDGSVSEGLFGGSFREPDFRDSAFASSPLGKSILEEEANYAASSKVVRLTPDSVPNKTDGMSQQQTIAAALMRAGITNPAAWSAAGVTTAETMGHGADSCVQSPIEGFDPQPAVALMKGKNNSTFLISWRSQREVARSLGWKCALMIWSGPALALISLYGLLTLTHLI
ncbi:MAG: hypothetical protein ABR874_02235 [Candidatus Sulfotelmatobacter sp.]|jgi:hypothetical protein